MLIGHTRVDLKTWEVSDQGRQFRLAEKPFRVLIALLERPGELVTRAELQERLWPDGTVATLRTALGDSARSPTMIQTLPRLGYRLVCEIQYGEPQDSTSSSQTSEPSGTRAAAFTVGAVVALSAAVVLALVWVVANGRDVDNDIRVPSTASARRAWQRGAYLQAQDTTESRALAVDAYEETVRQEPDFALAHVRLAETLAEMSFSRELNLREGLSRARLSATHALSIDGASASALRVRSLANLHLDWDFVSAGMDLESALRLDRNNADVYLAAATFLSALGRNDAAVLAAERAVDLDPASSLFKADLGYFLVAAGRYAEALEMCDELLRLDPSSVSALFFRAVAAEHLGRFEESLAGVRQVMQLRGASKEDLRPLQQGDAKAALTTFRRWDLAAVQARTKPSSFDVAVRYAALDERVQALASLEQSLKEREPWLLSGAKVLGVARHTLSRVLNGHAGISPEMAIRLEKAGWSNAEFWMRRQASYDLAQARKDERRIKVKPYVPTGELALQ